MDSSHKRLKSLFNSMFQIDRGDLDFGLYRIINHKSKEIDRFINESLLGQVNDILEIYFKESLERLKTNLKDDIAKLKSLGESQPDKFSTIVELNKQINSINEARSNAENSVYNHLAEFFSHYYNEGDFIPHRRFRGDSDSTYRIPYNGEEVKLHWASADHYYVKTTESYTAYIFIPYQGPQDSTESKFDGGGGRGLHLSKS